MWLSLPVCILPILVAPVLGALDLQWGTDRDLTNFVTRPEIKAPLFNISIYDAAHVTPGYWLIAPYAMIYQQRHPSRYYEPCQTGPAIYDQRGNLVWSGACKVRNQNTCDFRAWQFNNSLYMSGILTAYEDVGDVQGHGILMDDSFTTVSKVDIGPNLHNINMHELNVIDDGTKAIYIVHQPTEIRESDLKPNGSRKILDIGFREVNIATGETEFEWWAYRSGQVKLEESMVVSDGYPIKLEDPPYNWFHGNAVDKNSEGDYLLSSRFTNTIFKISGEDGSIIWRLGGRNSSFVQGFNFSRQHDARWLSSTDDLTIISFLNNAADDFGQTANTSSAMIVELDQRQMTASLIKSIPRPDSGLTRMRGNHQVLDNGNSFICWSENSYLSEHDREGKLLFEARFASRRFVTYRAYKANFTTNPVEPPVAKAFRYGASAQTSVIVVYVSWNGATEVASWRFRSGAVTIGEAKKTGFETMFQVDGHHHSEILVEALDGDGNLLRATTASILDPLDDVALFRNDAGFGGDQPRSFPVALSGDRLAFHLIYLTAALLCFALGLSFRTCCSQSWVWSKRSGHERRDQYVPVSVVDIRVKKDKPRTDVPPGLLV